jgi:RNA polymerase sigma factor (sigma-70 family)
MSGPVNSAALKALLTGGYDDLKRRLARRLGSLDAAGDVLQETYLRLERFDGLVTVGNPRAYLFRMALNVASDHQKAGRRLLNAVEIEDLWRLGDDTIDPETIVAAQSELALFKKALSELPPRVQQILIAARVDDLPHDVIARRFNLSTRMVQYELRRALEYCARRLQRKVVRRFGPPGANQS